ncbi:MAG TPA: hypothetical protein VFK05_34890 [Polyangiaceae bacterium]|nr:hypothetical protein [Polyangiaceae bacterium]
MSLLTTAERLSAPLDSCRRGWFSWLVRSDFLLATLADRDRRIATVACLSVVSAALGAVYFPVLLFLLGPVVLGVAHVAADVRYLVLRRNLARWWQCSVWLGCGVLLALRVCEELGWLRHAERLEFCAAAAFIGVAVFAALRERGSLGRALLACALLAVATSCALSQPRLSRYVFVHAHNLIALLAWATLFRANKRWLLAPVALIAGGVGLLASGALVGQTLSSPFAASFHLHVFTVSDWLAPFADPRLAIAVTTSYLFLQSVHYSVWLSWIPQEEQPRRGTPTFRMSVRALFSDLGTSGVAALGLTALAVWIGAYFNLHRAQSLYLSLAMFHGYLELALLTFFWVRGANPAHEPNPAQQREAEAASPVLHIGAG